MTSQSILSLNDEFVFISENEFGNKLKPKNKEHSQQSKSEFSLESVNIVKIKIYH